MSQPVRIPSLLYTAITPPLMAVPLRPHRIMQDDRLSECHPLWYKVAVTAKDWLVYHGACLLSYQFIRLSLMSFLQQCISPGARTLFLGVQVWNGNPGSDCGAFYVGLGTFFLVCGQGEKC